MALMEPIWMILTAGSLVCVLWMWLDWYRGNTDRNRLSVIGGLSLAYLGNGLVAFSWETALFGKNQPFTEWFGVFLAISGCLLVGGSLSHERRSSMR
ncbi:hypothetical protein [Halocatena halophila]|uniref:hypothetical protein n=1 Tax=Halocatena halophila TaxID=2814576 RepID=UPI002ED1C414